MKLIIAKHRTPNWYQTKKDTGKVVPTWDYEVAHVRGQLKLIDDAQWLYSFLDTLTNEHEANEAEAWKITDAPEGYIEAMLKAIVGLEIEIDEAIMKSKLNQNHPERNQQGIVEGLKGNVSDRQAQIAKQIALNLNKNP